MMSTDGTVGCADAVHPLHIYNSVLTSIGVRTVHITPPVGFSVGTRARVSYAWMLVGQAGTASASYIRP